jgi:hypothetical protein
MKFRCGDLGLVLAVTVCACSRYSTHPAVLVARSDTAELNVPASVRAGEPFSVSVSVFAGGCTREVARAEVAVRRDTAEIRPVMRRRDADVCTADLLILRERVELRFDTPGMAVVRAVGVREGPPADSSGQAYTVPVRLERRVRVLPSTP